MMNMAYPINLSEADHVTPDTRGTGGTPVPDRMRRQPRTDPWMTLPLLEPDLRRKALEGEPLMEFHRDHAASHAFDLMRTRLISTLRQNGWSRIAIAAPHTGCGGTFTAVNLALSMARVPGSRTVLADLDQRAPGVASMLSLPGRWPISDFLSAHVGMENYMIRCSDTLAVAPNTERNADAAEQLHDAVTDIVLEDMQEELSPDVVLYDMPAMLEYDDVAAFLPHVDGVLLVADGTRTLPKHITQCERILEGQTRLLGVVLNRGRITDS